MMSNTDSTLSFKSLMSATHDELERLTKGVIDTYDTNKLQDFDMNAAIAAESKDLFSRCDDYKNGFAEVRSRRKIADTVPDRNLHDQIIKLPCGTLWLAGIYRNNLDQTLIEVIGEKAVKFADLKLYLPKILAFFSWCKPEMVSIWSKPNSAHFLALKKVKGAELEDCFWGAKIEHISKLNSNEIALKSFDLANDWSWYKDEYHTFHKDVPQLKDRLEVEDKESVAESVENNLCYVAYKAHQPTQKIGALILEPCTELGYKGVLISDFIIAKQHRGQGFGPKIQAEVLSQISSRFEFICGYIYAGNQASMNNAKHTRTLLRTEITLPIEHFVDNNDAD
ncbi:hypothetical protein [Pseudoalteromonas umbrosa]|uniref:hypothetical protein n=1 Tax=Pseudoalteromonas umbrosa TaxID=3048489 RepID=UPI0024C43E6E|nr:hypothetical protein [Pseudoalteromonas sp. B95]MDK1285776.1 hypothetical protein [Pseudoalteromonas sp. B95]